MGRPSKLPEGDSNRVSGVGDIRGFGILSKVAREKPATASSSAARPSAALPASEQAQHESPGKKKEPNRYYQEEWETQFPFIALEHREIDGQLVEHIVCTSCRDHKPTSSDVS